MTSIRHLDSLPRRPRPAIDGVARAAVLALAGRLRWGTLAIDDVGNGCVVGNGPPEVHVRVTDPRAWSYAALHGSAGLGEAYVRGWWDCDDLTALVRIALRALEPVMRRLDRVGGAGARLTDPVHRLRRARNERLAVDRANVQAHYDLSNEFFSLFLDETMTYSCAIFDPPGSSLADAQRTKLDRVCRLLDLGPDDHLLEIGTGWGSLAIHAASRYGCRVTTTTISAAQHELALKRVSEAGVAHLVTVRPDDYRDLRGQYRKLASIEMIEAVDWRDHDEFFRACGRLLTDDGIMALQAIVIDDAAFDRSKRGEEFIKRFVFPGGCLPSIESIVHSAARSGSLRLVSLDDIGHYYPETLRAWRSRFEANRGRIGALGLDDTFRRLWRLYLCYCEAAFLERRVSDVQALLAKPDADATNRR